MQKFGFWVFYISLFDALMSVLYWHVVSMWRLSKQLIWSGCRKICEGFCTCVVDRQWFSHKIHNVTHAYARGDFKICFFLCFRSVLIVVLRCKWHYCEIWPKWSFNTKQMKIKILHTYCSNRNLKINTTISNKNKCSHNKTIFHPDKQ